MKKRILILFLIFCPLILAAQVTFIISELPENTPKSSSIYISGDFEGWTGGQKEFRLNRKADHYEITIPEKKDPIQFKFTLGSWETVETDQAGNNIENRNYTFKKQPDTIKIRIAAWANNDQNRSTATKNVSVLSQDFLIPQLKRKRRIWLYLPPDYQNSGKNYPVIYMQDGQNLFDRSTSFSGEWEVDESLNDIFKETGKGFIVVGIENGGKKRLDEYSPWKNEKYGGGEGAAYIDFIVRTLKPYVDEHYRTLPDQKNTAIFGSSMGGLISFYAGLKYPDIFGKAGVFSPSFWFSEKSFDLARTHGDRKDLRIFMLAGDQEGENTSFDEISQTVLDMNKMADLLRSSGFRSDNIQTKIIPEGKHNEKLWRENFKDAIEWLFDL